MKIFQPHFVAVEKPNHFSAIIYGPFKTLDERECAMTILQDHFRDFEGFRFKRHSPLTRKEPKYITPSMLFVALCEQENKRRNEVS